MQQALERRPLSSDELLKILEDDQLAPDSTLPETGIGQHWERILSPIFIRSATYGTRASTVLLINQKQQVRMVERSWRPNGKYNDKQVEFKIGD